MARILSDQVLINLPPAIKASDRGQWVNQITCHKKLAITPWDERRIWSDMYQRLSVAPFNARSSNRSNLAYVEQMGREATSRINPEADLRLYEEALAERPGDYHLRSRFGYYLEVNGQLDRAVSELQWVCDTFPDFEGGHQELGVALLLMERYEEARERFERVLEIRPGYPNAIKALELIEEKQP